ILRREAHGLAAAGLGLLQAPEVPQRNCQCVLRDSEIRSETHNLARQCNGIVVATPLKTKYPEVVQRTDMTSVDLQDSAIESFSLIESTLRVQRTCLLEYRFNGNRFALRVC